MELKDSLYLAFMVVLFGINLDLTLRNFIAKDGKPWLGLVTLVGAVAAAFGFIRTLAEVLGQ